MAYCLPNVVTLAPKILTSPNGLMSSTLSLPRALWIFLPYLPCQIFGVTALPSNYRETLLSRWKIAHVSEERVQGYWVSSAFHRGRGLITQPLTDSRVALRPILFHRSSLIVHDKAINYSGSQLSVRWIYTALSSQPTPSSDYMSSLHDAQNFKRCVCQFSPPTWCGHRRRASQTRPSLLPWMMRVRWESANGACWCYDVGLARRD